MEWKLELNLYTKTILTRTDLSNKEDDDNEQETSEMKFEEFALKTNVLASASSSKAKAKPQRRTSASHLQELYLSVKDLGLM